MRIRTFTLSLVLLGGSLAAQIPQIPPAVTKFTSTGSTFEPPAFPALSPSALGFTASGTASSTPLNQIELRPTSGTFYRLGVSATGVPANLGGVGGADVVEGVFDAASNNVQLTNLAAAFNTSGNERTISISEDGLWAVVTGSGGGAVWGNRTAGAPWPTPQIVSGITTNVFEAKLYTDGTQLKLAWRDDAGTGKKAGHVWSGDFNNGVVSNARILIDKSVSTRIGFQSPHPVTQEIPAGSGNYVVLGWYAVRRWNALDTDTVWIPGADPSVSVTEPPKPLVIWNEPAVQQNGTTLGTSGTQFSIYSKSSAPVQFATVSLSGWNFSAAAGGTVYIRAMVPWSLTDSWLTAIFLGPSTGPLAIPLTIGDPLGQPTPNVPLGMLGVTPVVTLQAPVSPAAPGGFTFSFNVAAGSLPANAPIPMQVVGVNLTAGGIYLGNTAAIEGY